MSDSTSTTGSCVIPVKSMAVNNKRIPSIFLLFCLLSGSIWAPVFAGAPVWKVEKNGNHVFIGGTVHLLTPADYPLPDAFEIAYRQSDQLIFETNLNELKTPEFQVAMLNKLSYPAGQNLQQSLSHETYQALTRHCLEHGIAIEALVPFKPSLVSMILSITELQRIGFTGLGVDEYYSQKAQQDNKPVGALETVEQQLNFISEMGKGREDELIIYTLTEMATLPQIMESMMGAWRQGDLNKLETVSADSLRAQFPGIHHNLIVTRNNAWMPDIEAMFNTPSIEFILVGSLHLSGKTGLLAQLKTRGYTVEMLDGPK